MDGTAAPPPRRPWPHLGRDEVCTGLTEYLTGEGTAPRAKNKTLTPSICSNTFRNILTCHNRKNQFEVFYLSISSSNFLLLLMYISEVNIVLSTPLHLSNSFTYFSDNSFPSPSCPVETLYLQIW